MQIHRVDTARCLVGEGPVWDAAGQALFFLDITGRKIHRFDPGAGTTRTWETPSSVGALALRERGGAALALTDGVYGFDFETGGLDLIARLETETPRERFNDGTTDRRGRFLIGSGDTNFEDTRPLGAINSLGVDHRLKVLERGINFSNGPCFSPDDRTFYFSDSLLHSTFAYDYDIETGEVANKRLFVNTTDLGGMPDGATVDRDGLVWMAIFRAGKIAAFRPDGKLERVVAMPVRMAVSVAFGGQALDQLYVTTIDPTFFGEPAEDGGGDVYVIEGLGARGVPEPRYAG